MILEAVKVAGNTRVGGQALLALGTSTALFIIVLLVGDFGSSSGNNPPQPSQIAGAGQGSQPQQGQSRINGPRLFTQFALQHSSGVGTPRFNLFAPLLNRMTQPMTVQPPQGVTGASYSPSTATQQGVDCSGIQGRRVPRLGHSLGCNGYNWAGYRPFQGAPSVTTPSGGGQTVTPPTQTPPNNGGSVAVTPQPTSPVQIGQPSLGIEELGERGPAPLPNPTATPLPERRVAPLPD